MCATPYGAVLVLLLAGLSPAAAATLCPLQGDLTKVAEAAVCLAEKVQKVDTVNYEGVKAQVATLNGGLTSITESSQAMDAKQDAKQLDDHKLLVTLVEEVSSQLSRVHTQLLNLETRFNGTETAPPSQYSCRDIFKDNPKAKSGYYSILVDKNTVDRKIKQPQTNSIEVFCEMSGIDGLVWTLVEMIGRTQNVQTPFDYGAKNEGAYNADRLPSFWAWGSTGSGRLGKSMWDSIFKHSYGYVQLRYAENKAGYSLTDVFGHPEGNKHLLDKQCSHKGSLSVALAYRGSNSQGNSMGYCFKDGNKDQDSNCICSDTHGGNMNFNRCANQHGNWRRYTSYRKSDGGSYGNKNWGSWRLPITHPPSNQPSKFCNGMHRKCYNVQNHVNLGDSYGCDVGGQRGVGGHMWLFYSNNRGAPCHNNGGYNCKGSRWIA